MTEQGINHNQVEVCGRINQRLNTAMRFSEKDFIQSNF